MTNAGRELKTTRIEALSDGIFAISMTILILGFESFFKQPAEIMSEQDLIGILTGLWPDFVHYVESFMILGAFWYQHHRQFHFIKSMDAAALFINMTGLMFVALIPFSAVMLGDYGNTRLAALLFECNLFLAGLTFFAHWVYVSYKHRFVDKDLPLQTITYYRKRNLIIPVISLFAAAISLFQPRSGAFLYFLVPVILIIWRRK